MDIDLQSGPSCPNDRYDNGGTDNDTLTTGTPLDIAQLRTGSANAEVGLRICDFDEDHFCVTLQDDDQVKFEVRFDAQRGDLDAALFAQSGTTPVQQGMATTAGEEVVYTVPSGGAGTYCLQVKGQRSAAQQLSAGDLYL